MRFSAAEAGPIRCPEDAVVAARVVDSVVAPALEVPLELVSGRSVAGDTACLCPGTGVELAVPAPAMGVRSRGGTVGFAWIVVGAGGGIAAAGIGRV